MNVKPVVIIISGPPATGKTTLAKKISEQFSLPCVQVDGIKELMLDTMGSKDLDWNDQLSPVAYQLAYYSIERLLITRHPFVVEGMFKSSMNDERLNTLKKKYPFRPFQIQLKADREIILERFRSRFETGNRHPGFFDHENYPRFEKLLKRGYMHKLNIGGKLIEIDTTDFDTVDYGLLMNDIKKLLNT